MLVSGIMHVDNNSRYTSKPDLTYCKCGQCEHDSKAACMHAKCSCCDLEDMFSILSQYDFAPKVMRTSFEYHSIAE